MLWVHSAWMPCHPDGVDPDSEPVMFGGPIPVDRRLQRRARRLHSKGADTDAVAAWLVAHGCGPMPAIKILKTLGVDLGEAKIAISAASSQEERDAHERLVESIDEFIREVQDEQTEPQ